MATSANTLKTLFSIIGMGRLLERTSSTSTAPVTRASETVATQPADEEQIFLTSIADLEPEEREKRIQRREWYKRLAERQAIAEVEYQMDQDLRNSGPR